MHASAFSYWCRTLPAALACAAFLAAAVSAAPAAPAASARRIMAGDRLNISVKEQSDLNRVYAVAGDGSVDFAFAGRVVIGELTADEAARKLEEVLESRYFREAHVDISIANFVEGDVYVTGAVRSPQSLPFRGDSIMTLVEAITQCGGLSEDAAGDRVRILRWRPGGTMEKQSIDVNVQYMMDTLDFANDQYLRPRDYIIVPRRGNGSEERNEFLAMGEVRQPGYHPYSPNMDVIQAVTLVGGLGEFADWAAARIMRKQPNGEYAILPVDLNRLFSAADMECNLPMKKGDIFIVPSVRNVVSAQILLLGEVQHPGAVSFMPGPQATAARIILAHGGLTDFADGRVRLQRLAPDGSKKTLVLDIGKILKKGDFEDDVALQDGDVLVAPEAGILDSFWPF